jgi:hypothetical protein
MLETSTADTGQNVHQKNTGIGESVNFNCGENLIKAGVGEQECKFEDQKSKQVGLTSLNWFQSFLFLSYKPYVIFQVF